MDDTRGQPAIEPSPQLKRVLGVTWVVVVVLVGLCVFLGAWWSTQDGGLSTAAEPTNAPAAAGFMEVASPTPAPTSEEGQPILDPMSLTPQPTPTALPVADRGFGIGVMTDARYQTERTLSLVQQLGVGWIQQTVRWAEIEQEPGEIDWSRLDPVFAATSAQNLKVMVTVTAAPDWARSVTAAGYDGPPDNVDAYLSFVSLLIQRYRGAIHAIEVWREMNTSAAWYAPGGISAAGYMNLLVPTAHTIHTQAPGVIVISGGLNPTGIDDGVVATDDYRYLQSLIEGGLLNYVDCVGLHHQGYNLPPDVAYDAAYVDVTASFQQPFDNPHHSWSFYSTVRGYRDMIVTAGQETPICVTEFGWPSLGNFPRRNLPAFVYDNTLEEQADYVLRAVQLMEDWGFTWLAMVSNLDYSPTNTEDEDQSELTPYYRLITTDGEPRPVFEALAEYLSQR